MTFKEPAEQIGLAGDAVPTGARKLLVNHSDLDKYGYTNRCPQYEHVKKHGKIRVGGNHSDACRARITECIREHRGGTQARE